jgi:hypothetical protein
MAVTPEGRDLATTEPEFEPNPVMHLLAPVIAIVATMAVRKALSIGYEQVTGRKPPVPRDPAVRFSRAVAWAVTTAATAAAVETIVYRVTNQAGRPRA